MIQVEAAEGEEPSKRLRCQVVQRVVAKTKKLNVLQPLEEEEEEKEDCCGIALPNTSKKIINVFTHNLEYLEDHVRDVNQLVVGYGQCVEEAELCEGSRLDLLDAIVVKTQLFQGGETVKGLLQQ